MEKDYSGSSLRTKLGIHEGDVVVLLHAPDQFDTSVFHSTSLRLSARGRADVVLAFFHRRADLGHQRETLLRIVGSSGALWIAWPKKSSGVITDMTDQFVRDEILPGGLVDNKVCSIDDTWTALRFVVRREQKVSS